MSALDRIGLRYRSAIPGSNQLEDAGVIIHFTDGFEDPGRPWAGCSPSNPQCGFLGDRISASVVYRELTQDGVTFAHNGGGTYKKGGGGVIINPHAARMLCAYGIDGATRGKLCSPPGPSDTCIPACITKYDGTDAVMFYEKWCASQDPLDYHCEGHPWKPSDLGTMLGREREAQERGIERSAGNKGYNEVRAPLIESDP